MIQTGEKETTMSLYRCAVCGSSKIVPETKQEGYNTKKGVIGAVLFGGIGALAGTKGNTVTYYHCGDCGQVLNHTMMPAERDAIDNCLVNPDVFESSLKRYKAQYKNIEWEESISVSASNTTAAKMEISDIEECILGYMKKIGVPVPMEDLRKKIGIDELEYAPDIRSATENLEKRGILKLEKIGENLCYILVTDIDEMKEVALQYAANKRAKELVRTKKYIPIIKEVLSNQSMSDEEIYTYLKENNHLSEEVIKAEKENVYIPQYFMKACMLKWIKEESLASRTSVASLTYENGKYRMKTSEEMENSKVVAEQKANKEIIKEIETLKPLIKVFQNSKTPITPVKIGELNKEFEKYTTMQLKSKLMGLVKAGILQEKEIKKNKHYYLAEISQAEIDNKLFEAVANKTVRGFLD